MADTSERSELEIFLADLESDGFKRETIEVFRRIGEALLCYDVVEVAEQLREIKAAMANEYGE